MNHLNQTQIDFLNITACFIKDRIYEDYEPGDMRALIELAASHRLSPAVFEVLRTSLTAAQQADISWWNGWKSTVIRDFAFQIQRTEGFLAVYRKFLEAGVKPLVVKGVVCRSLYSKPDCRVSGDEDLLIHPADAPVCDKILLENGFVRGELDFAKLPHEIGYRNPVNGVYLEMHYSLFDDDSNTFGRLNEVFSDVFEKAVCLKISDTDIWTLEPTEHLLYLVCHSYKHFLHSGFGIRQVCDMVLMAEKWGADMDWKYLCGKLEEFHMLKFFTGLLEIGTGWLMLDEKVYGYLGSDASSPESCKRHTEDLLLDILLGGIYGSSTSERLHSANMTLAAAEKKSGLKRSLFPDRSYMEGRYPFVKKSVLLLPIAWIMRICKYISKKGNRDNSVEIGKQRVELLKKYDIIR